MKHFLIYSSLLAIAWSGYALAKESWKVNFAEADIQEVIKFVADATGTTLVIDPRVKGQVNVISERELNARELYDLFLSILEVHGFAAVESGGIVQIIPRREAPSRPQPIL